MRYNPVLLLLLLSVLTLPCIAQGQPVPLPDTPPAGQPTILGEADPQAQPETAPAAPVAQPAPDVAPVVAVVPAGPAADILAGTATPDQPLIPAVAKGTGDLVDAWKTRGWLAGLAAAVLLLTGLLRRKEFGGLLDKLPKRARILVPAVLGCVGAFLAGITGNLPWSEALVLAVLTGPMAVALHQAVARSLMGLESPDTKAAKELADG